VHLDNLLSPLYAPKARFPPGVFYVHLFVPAEHLINMQFGRISGLALVVLGIILCGLQAVLIVAPKKDSQAAEVTAKSQHRATPLPGIVGVGSLITGIALFATARRKDEPPAKYAVK